MKVAVPWSLSHYISANGFHPLYRALVDHAPERIQFRAWDNVKLQTYFAENTTVRENIHALSARLDKKIKKNCKNTIQQSYDECFTASNRLLTEALGGDLEFHHTVPFPSLTRPFVLHCETFEPLLLPFARQNGGEADLHEDLRAHYKAIVADPLCLGVFSHIPETLRSFSQFFADSEIDQKLFGSRIGLSDVNFETSPGEPVANLQNARFLFINSAIRDPGNFFDCGGGIVLKFWYNFITSGRSGRLMLLSAKPNGKLLRSNDIDAGFVDQETGRSIIWIEDCLANHETNALMENAHFCLLPGRSLDSVSIMNALRSGTVPVVTDTIGTDTFVTDSRDAIVLKGVREESCDAIFGVAVSGDGRSPSLDRSLTTQITQRVFEILDDAATYERLRNQAMATSINRFSGMSFAADFWSAVEDRLSEMPRRKLRTRSRPGLEKSLNGCTLERSDWSRVFESATQPVRRLYTGVGTVWEYSGTFMHISGDPPSKLEHWSVLNPYLDPTAPQTMIANNLVDLNGKFLVIGAGREPLDRRRFHRMVSNLLLPYPALHAFVARLEKFRRRAGGFLSRRVGVYGTERGGNRGSR